MSDQDSMEVAIKTGWIEYQTHFADWWAERSDFQEDKPAFAAAIRAAAPILIQYGRELAAHEIKKAFGEDEYGGCMACGVSADMIADSARGGQS